MNKIIFLTGLPRSGTKLLRDLMNNHSRISIPTIETVLIPYLTSKFGLSFDLSNEANFTSLCDSFKQSTFYNSYKRNNLDIGTETLYNRLPEKNWTSFFEEILKFYGPKQYREDVLIGDKTPGYIDHTDLILELWPNAKIIHIIRDPRDYICSARKVWKKNIYRAAHRWNNTMEMLESRTNLNKSNYLAVYYESLLDDPKKLMSDICNFLGIVYEPAMIQLQRPSEQFGDAKGQKIILKSNKQKYRNLLSKRQIKKVEQILFDTAQTHGYQLDNPNLKPRKLSKLDLLRFKFHDGINSWKFHIGRRGIFGGTKYFFQLHRENI